jgi:hypothetical protein
VACVGRGLCNELITSSEMSYRICTCAGACIFVCDLCISITRLHEAGLGCMATLDAGRPARSQYLEVSATGHIGTGFSWFPCV